MGKCKCYFGKVSGTIGELTFCYRRGQQIVYLKTPREKLIRYKIKNLNSNIIFSIMTQIYNRLKTLIPLVNYWNIKDKNLTEYNLFFKNNTPSLYNSIPDKNKIISPENWISTATLWLTDGGKQMFEKTIIEKFTCEQNLIQLQWDSRIWKDGNPDDTAHIFIIHCPPPENMDPNQRKCELNLKILYSTAQRQHGNITIETLEPLDPTYLSALLFFTNNSAYSPTSGSSIIP